MGALLLPGHVENIAGFAGFRAAVDRFIGQRNAVVAGAALMSAGHLAMAFDQSFLVALALLILGSGLLKGNISADVGALYGVDDEANRVRAYTVFSMAINIGAVLGPIVCGLLAQLYGWHMGFGAAALFILIDLVTYMILVVPILAFGEDRLSPIWPFLYFAMMGFSFLFYWPVTLALVSRAAPAPVNATMMGMAFLALFVGSNIMGRLGGLYEALSPAMFWSLHATVAAAGGVAVLMFGGAIARELRADI